MATEREIIELEDSILKNCSNRDFLVDLFAWAREKYARVNIPNKVMHRVVSLNNYHRFLIDVFNYGWYMSDDGPYHIIRYLSHGEQAPPPVHIRMILDSDKQNLKTYIKNCKW